MKIVGVYLCGVPYAADKRYDYILPPALSFVKRGSLLTVPFGKGDRHRPAVAAFIEEREDAVGLKTVFSAEDGRFSLSEELFSLALFLREYTFCSFGDAVRALLPPALLSGKAAMHIKTKAYYRPTDRAMLPALLEGKLRSPAYRAALSALLEKEELSEEEAAALSVNRQQLLAMVKNGWITEQRREVLRDPYGEASPNASPIVLSRAQREAYESLLSLYEKGEASAALLYGVTGSGKTNVMMKLMDRVIEAGRGVILMVPEIALTPQTVGIFRRRYGGRVAVIHSSLSAGERFDTWRRIAEGGVDLVIGTRSAVFAPLPDVGLILVDEEHEHTYKSDADPKYHTRDVAAYRAAHHKALAVFASATPALESFYKAEKGVYTLVPLRERFGGNPLPTAEVVDLRQELRSGNTSPLSRKLNEALCEVGEKGEQAILFLNRRGYHAVLHCKACGHVFECPNCSVSLTHHEGGDGGYLLCHTCGHREAMPRECPSCLSKHLSYLGAGTQRAEGELSAMHPTLSVMRMDADTTSTKEAYDRMLEDFRAHKADILLGTQMVTKGHDFPSVTLSGVLLADLSLHISDYRASERTFSLLTQVIGRAGRGKVAGRALSQTYNPDNDVIALACKQDYDTFYRREIALRRELLFPPFCDLVQMTLSGLDEGAVSEAARALSEQMTASAAAECPKEPMVIFGPFEARTFKAEGKFRMKMLLKCKLNRAVRRYIGALLCKYTPRHGVTLSVDCNPTDI